jgi:hypothetical protein
VPFLKDIGSEWLDRKVSPDLICSFRLYVLFRPFNSTDRLRKVTTKIDYFVNNTYLNVVRWGIHVRR